MIALVCLFLKEVVLFVALGQERPLDSTLCDIMLQIKEDLKLDLFS